MSFLITINQLNWNQFVARQSTWMYFLWTWHHFNSKPYDKANIQQTIDCYILHTHYRDVIMNATASQITSLDHDCLLNRLFRRRSKKTSKLRITDLCEGNSPVTGEFPSQRACNAEIGSIWWRHHISILRANINTNTIGMDYFHNWKRVRKDMRYHCFAMGLGTQWV